MLKAKYQPKHKENRMKHEGDVASARKQFLNSPPLNLYFLLKNRYLWMNKYINPSHRGIEVGGGTGISKIFIKSKNYKVTDFSNHKWLDIKNVDALKTPFRKHSLDFVVSSNMVHHVPYPVIYFREMARILKPGGYLLIQEINASLAMRIVLRVMRHEGYNFFANVFNPNQVCTDPKDLWSANCAIPNLLFDDEDKFHKQIPFFKIEKQSFSEFFNFLNSGGVIAKTYYIKLPLPALKLIKVFDDFLANLFPSIFALQRQIVLRKTND